MKILLALCLEEGDEPADVTLHLKHSTVVLTPLAAAVHVDPSEFDERDSAGDGKGDADETSKGST